MTNAHLANLITHLSPYASEIARKCRSGSQIRAKIKNFEFAEQKVLEKLDIINQSVISKRAAVMIKREIGTHLSEMKHAMGFDLLTSKDQIELQSRFIECENLVDSLSNQAKSNDDPLVAIPKNKQTAYREVFDLIYDCSASAINAKSLIDRILNRISKV